MKPNVNNHTVSQQTANKPTLRSLKNNSFAKTLLASAMALAVSLPAKAQVEVLDQVVALVENTVVTQSDVDHRIEQVKTNVTSGNLPPDKVLQKEVLDRLIVEAIQLQMGERAGVRISDAELNATIERIAKRNGQSPEQFRQTLAKEGRTYGSVRKQIRNEMILNQVQQGNLRSRIQITEQEVNNFLNSEEGSKLKTARYALAHIVLPNASSDEDKAFMSQLAKDLNAGKYQFEALLKNQSVQGRELKGGNLGWRTNDTLPSLFAPVVADMKAGEVSEPVKSGAGIHLVKVFDKQGGKGQLVEQHRVRHILVKPSKVRSEQQTKELIEAIAKRIEKGESFEALAKEYSEDPGSALQGGDLNWTNKGVMVPEFEKTMLASPLNTVSKPFTTQFGWHILEVTGKRMHDMSEERWKQQAYNSIYQRKYKDELTAWLQKIRDEAFVEFKQFDTSGPKARQTIQFN